MRAALMRYSLIRCAVSSGILHHNSLYCRPKMRLVVMDDRCRDLDCDSTSYVPRAARRFCRGLSIRKQTDCWDRESRSAARHPDDRERAGSRAIGMASISLAADVPSSAAITRTYHQYSGSSLNEVGWPL